MLLSNDYNESLDNVHAIVLRVPAQWVSVSSSRPSSRSRPGLATLPMGNVSEYSRFKLAQLWRIQSSLILEPLGSDV